MLNNQYNKRGRQIKVNVHGASSLYSFVTGESKFSEICYCW